MSGYAERERDRALDALCAAFGRELDEADPAAALGRAYVRAFGPQPARREPGEDPGIRCQRELEEFYAEREAEQAARDAQWATHQALGEAPGDGRGTGRWARRRTWRRWSSAAGDTGFASRAWCRRPPGTSLPASGSACSERTPVLRPE